MEFLFMQWLNLHCGRYVRNIIQRGRRQSQRYDHKKEKILWVKCLSNWKLGQYYHVQPSIPAEPVEAKEKTGFDCVHWVPQRNKTDGMNHKFTGEWIRVASTLSPYDPDSPTMVVLHWRDQERGSYSMLEAAVPDSWEIPEELLVFGTLVAQ